MRSPGRQRGLSRLRYMRTTDLRGVSSQALLGMERALAECGLEAVSNPQGPPERLLGRIASELHLMRRFRTADRGPVVVGMMGYTEGKTFPFSYWTELVPYVFDCWPKWYRRWTSFFRRHRVRVAFFTARQSASYFAQQIPEMRSIWLPEAVDAGAYHRPRPLAERSIDVLEMGRMHDGFHAAVVGPLAESGRLHLYETSPGARIFPSESALISGLADCKISVCFPRVVTHPEHVGGVETVTHRYFESIASGCIVFGHCPDELSDLFGYNPVVEIECGNEARQIERILTDVGSYESLVEANYERLLEVGTWHQRAVTLLDQLEAMS